MSTAAFLDQLYEKLLHRPADSGGKEWWAMELDSGRTDGTEITSVFIQSEEFQDSVASVARLYYLLFDRTPDSDGMQFWTQALREGTSLEEIATSFVESNEFHATFGSFGSNETFLSKLYDQAFDRAPDPDGETYWASAMEHGASIAAVVTAFANSDEYGARINDRLIDTALYQATLFRDPLSPELIDASQLSDAELIEQLYTDPTYSGVAAPGVFQITETPSAYNPDSDLLLS